MPVIDSEPRAIHVAGVRFIVKRVYIRGKAFVQARDRKGRVAASARYRAKTGIAAYRERFARDLAFSPRESGESRSYTILSRHTGVVERTRIFKSPFAVVEGDIKEGRRPSFAVSSRARKSLQYVFIATFKKKDGSTFEIAARSRKIGSPGVSNIRAARKEAL